MATPVVSMFAPTADLPVWVNREKVERISEKVQPTDTRGREVRKRYPVVLALPNGSSYTLPFGHYVVGRCFEKMKSAELLQPYFLPVERAKLHDPLNLLAARAEDPASVGLSVNNRGEQTCYGKTQEQWRSYLAVAKDEQVTQDYGKPKILRKIAEFCNVTLATDTAFLDGVGTLRKWAQATK